MKWQALAVAYFSISQVFFNLGFAATTAPVACQQDYALCTSAQCIPDPRNPQFAICNCSHQQGSSLGYSSCVARKPYVDAHQVTHLTSTFSLADVLSHKKGMECQTGPWTNCLDQPCTINPLNPKQTICSCPIVFSGKFLTFGGDCNQATCSTGFWSAALASQAEILMNPIRKASGQANLSDKELMCPIGAS